MVRAVAPMFDMMNHAACPNAIGSIGVDGSVTVEARRAIGAGEEVTLFYDSMPNTKALLTYGFLLDGDGAHRSMDLLVQFPPPLGLESQGLRAEVHLLGDGSVANRVVLGPFLRQAKEGVPDVSGERRVGEMLLHCAHAERHSWEALAGTSKDERLVFLGSMCADILDKFSSRLQQWLDSPDDVALVAILSRAPAPDLSTDSDSEE
ncbi:unnamed protein product, partial [Polarella glacialis]